MDKYWQIKQLNPALQSDLSQSLNIDTIIAQVLIFGDYDVDGVTSTALLNCMLTDFGLNVINFIPHRIEQGYGLNHEIAQVAQEKGVQLIITVDCGITACDEVDTINKLGIDVIIID